MTLKEKVKDRKIGIIGMARSGLAAAKLAQRLGGEVFVSDSARTELLSVPIASLTEARIPFETGGHTAHLLNCDYLIVSPGVPPNIDILRKAREKGIPVFSELEFAFWVCRGEIVAVTGSNGKTTTTTLIGEIFKASGRPTYVCGNIGKAFAEIADEVPEDGVTIVEVSTFQLETIDEFRPHVALLLNLSPDHLDRHGSFEAYKKMKYRTAENQQPDDYFIMNADDAESHPEEIATKAVKLRFSASEKTSANTFVKDNVLYANLNNKPEQIIKVDEIFLPGHHNLENAAAAVCAAKIYDIPADVIAKVLREFKGVEHRLEKVGSVAGVNFVNDSKATNVDSVCVALKAMHEPVYLILGGRDKGSSYRPIAEIGKDRIKGIFALGEAREKIFNALGRDFPLQFVDTLEAAVRRAFEQALPGETVLLSPGCASFDMFENFEHRGRVFKDAVENLRKNKKNETFTN